MVSGTESPSLAGFGLQVMVALVHPEMPNASPDQVDQDLLHRHQDLGEVQRGVQLVGCDVQIGEVVFCASISS